MTEVAQSHSRKERFRSIYEREVGFLLNFLRRLGVGASDVEDVAQEVFTNVYLKLDAYDASRPFRPWLAGFAVRVAASHRRRAARVQSPTEGVERAVAVGSGLGRVEAHQMVMRGLDRLAEREREVLVLHDLVGFSMPETVEVLGIPLNTGYSRLRDARERFRRAIGHLRREAG